MPQTSVPSASSSLPQEKPQQRQQQQRDAVASLMGPMVLAFAKQQLSLGSDSQAGETESVPHDEADVAAPEDSKSITTSPPSSSAQPLDPGALAAICCEVLVSVRRLDCLFGGLYDAFASSTASLLALLVALEPLILARRLTHLPPIRLLEFAREFAQRGWSVRLEACLLALEVEDPTAPNADDAGAADASGGTASGGSVSAGKAKRALLQPLLSATRHLGLLSAYARTCSIALGDYRSPIIALLSALQGQALDAAGSAAADADAAGVAGASGTLTLDWAQSRGLPAPPPLDEAARVAIGYKLLLYLRHCLAGFAFPSGERMPTLARVRSARRQACSYLYEQSHATAGCALARARPNRHSASAGAGI